MLRVGDCALCVGNAYNTGDTHASNDYGTGDTCVGDVHTHGAWRTAFHSSQRIAFDKAERAAG